MPFNRRPTRRWLRELPYVPVMSNAVEELDSTYVQTFNQRASSITTRTPIQRGLFRSIESFEPIGFIDLERAITLESGESLEIKMSDYVSGAEPLRYYVRRRPLWMTFDDGIISGDAPTDIILDTSYTIELLVENPSGTAIIAFDILVVGVRVLDDEGRAIVAAREIGLISNQGASKPLDVYFENIPLTVVTTTDTLDIDFIFSEAITGFGDLTDALLMSDDFTESYRAAGITGEDDRYVVSFTPPNDSDGVFFIRIPKLIAYKESSNEEAPVRNLDSIPFEIVITDDLDPDRVSLIPRGIVRELSTLPGRFVPDEEI